MMSTGSTQREFGVKDHFKVILWVLLSVVNPREFFFFNIQVCSMKVLSMTKRHISMMTSPPQKKIEETDSVKPLLTSLDDFKAFMA